MALLLGRKVTQQLSDRGLGRLTCRPCIEPFALRLHQFDLRTHFLESERPQQPDRLPFDEALNVLSTDQGDMFAELLAVEIEQAMTMLVLFIGHSHEHPCRSRVGLAQHLSKIIVGAIVLFLKGHGERQKLLLGQLRKVLHGPLALLLGPQILAPSVRSLLGIAETTLSLPGRTTRLPCSARLRQFRQYDQSRSAIPLPRYSYSGVCKMRLTLALPIGLM